MAAADEFVATSPGALPAALDAVCLAQAQARAQVRWLEGELTGEPLAASEFLLVWQVGHGSGEGAPQHALAEAVGLSPPQASVLLEKLRRAGWLESVRSTQDRRRQLWQLTGAGRQRFSSLVARMTARRAAHGEHAAPALRQEAAA